MSKRDLYLYAVGAAIGWGIVGCVSLAIGRDPSDTAERWFFQCLAVFLFAWGLSSDVRQED